MHQLTLLHAEYIAYRLALELMNYTTEPMPEFSSRYPNRLESCLDTPFQEFDGNELYPGLFKKAAVLFYLVTKNHPFENGNKRMAVTLTLTFLHLNGYSLNLTPESLYQISLIVAERNDDMGYLVEVLEIIFKEKSRPVGE